MSGGHRVSDGHSSGAGLTVLYVWGHPRSGSTLLGNILDSLPGVFHAGELSYLWTPGLPEPRQRCGCGRPVRECPTWRRVFSEAFGGGESGDGASSAVSGAATAAGLLGADPERLRSLQRAALGTLPSLRAVLRGRGWEPGGAAAEYLEAMSRLYRAIGDVTGSRVIVDSSKWPDEGRLIAGLATMAGRPERAPDVAFVHLLRGPWGAVFSRLPRELPGEAGSGGPPSRARVLLESLRWVKWNTLSELIARRSGRRWRTVRYEDFVADPAGVVRGIVAFALGEGAEPPEIELDGRTVELEENHTVGGNRNRWRSGPVEIRRDDRWRTGMRTSDATLVSLATLPYRRLHGYTR